MEKQSLNVKLNSEIYYQLKSEIGEAEESLLDQVERKIHFVLALKN